MMEQLILDNGIREFEINGGGVLRFNPADPNLYVRFSDAVEKLRELEQQLQARNVDASGMLALVREADTKIKKMLEEALGPGNDLNRALNGVNLLAVAGNGRRVVENLLDALKGVLAEGARVYAKQEAIRRMAQ